MDKETKIYQRNDGRYTTKSIPPHSSFEDHQICQIALLQHLEKLIPETSEHKNELLTSIQNTFNKIPNKNNHVRYSIQVDVSPHVKDKVRITTSVETKLNFLEILNIF
jgi:hypothetical protein